MTPDQAQSWLQIGVGGLILVALFLAYKRIWVWGWQLQQTEKERDEWKAMALDGLKAAADVAQASRKHTSLSAREAEEALRIVREAGHGNSNDAR